MHMTLLTLIVALLFSCGKPETSKTENTMETPQFTDSVEVATIKTNMGSFTIELYHNDAPKTVENFTGLAKKNYYNGILFHRVVRGFVIQAGDPNTKDPAKAAMWGSGGESIYGAKFADELNPATKSYKEGYKKGVVAMANAGPNTNGSQFFVCLDNVGLPNQYTIFGKVIHGQEVVDKIGQSKLGPRDVPVEAVKIESVTVAKEAVK